MALDTNVAIPAHVALILDGNGRCAKKRGLPRTLGHKEGCVTVEKNGGDCRQAGDPLSDSIRIFYGELETFF